MRCAACATQPTQHHYDFTYSPANAKRSGALQALRPSELHANARRHSKMHWLGSKWSRLSGEWDTSEKSPRTSDDQARDPCACKPPVSKRQEYRPSLAQASR